MLLKAVNQRLIGELGDIVLDSQESIVTPSGPQVGPSYPVSYI